MTRPTAETPDLDEMRRQLEALYEWMREPDWAAGFSASDLANWMNKRPCHVPNKALAVLDRLAAAEAEARSLREERDAMREALRPFAKITAHVCMRDDAQADVDFTRRIPSRNQRQMLKVSDIRRAAALVAGQEAAL